MTLIRAFRTERENLAGDANGHKRLQCPWSEGGRSSPLSLGQLGQTRRSPKIQWKAAAFVRWHEPDDARVSSPEPVRGSG